MSSSYVFIEESPDGLEFLRMILAGADGETLFVLFGQKAVRAQTMLKRGDRIEFLGKVTIVSEQKGEIDR